MKKNTYFVLAAIILLHCSVKTVSAANATRISQTYRGTQLCDMFDVKKIDNKDSSTISEWDLEQSTQDVAVIRHKGTTTRLNSTTIIPYRTFSVVLKNGTIPSYDNMTFDLDIESDQGEVTITDIQFKDPYRQYYNEGASYRETSAWREGYDHYLDCTLSCRTTYADSSSNYTGGPDYFYIRIRSLTVSYEAASFPLSDTTVVLGEKFDYPVVSGNGKYTYTSSNPEVAVVFDEILDPDDNKTPKKVRGYVLPIAEGTTTITAHDTEDGTSTSYNLHVIYQPSTTLGTVETITVEQPGTLRELASNLESTRIRELTLHGKLNADDLKYLREQSGRLLNLEAIDMKDVTFEYGGDEPYATVTKKVSGFIGNITHYYYLSNENSTVSGGSTNMLGGYDGWVKHYTDKLDNLFSDRAALRRVVWPDCVKGIGEEALAGTGIISFLFPDDITTIGDAAFGGCSKLLSVNVPSTATEIGKAFSNCTSLVNVGDLSHMKRIEASSFANCKHLIGNVKNKTLDLSGLDTIPSSAFCECRLLTKVKLSDNLKRIGTDAFSYAVNLSDIHLPEGLESIDAEDRYRGSGASAFNNCLSLKDVQIPSTLKRMSAYSFSGTPYQDNLPFEDGVKYIGHVAICSDRSLASLNFKEGTRIIADCFYGGGTLTTVCLPTTIKRIGNSAFDGSDNLETINLPEGLEEIGREAFYCQTGYSKLYGVRLPSTLKYIGTFAFCFCKNLDVITIPGNMEYLGSRVFQECTGIVKVNLLFEKELITAGDYSGSTYEEAGAFLFRNCTGIEKVTIGSKVPKIYQNWFEGCTSISKVEFDERTTGDTLSIGEGAFSGCTNLLSFVTSSGSASQKNMPAFAEDNEPSLNIPTFVSSLGESTFSKCSSIKKIVIPEGITTLPKYIFNNCSSVERVELPSTLKSTEDSSLNFADGSSSHPFDIYCAASVPPAITPRGGYGGYYSPFQSKLAGCRLYVLPEAVEAYQNAICWKDFEIIADATLGIEAAYDSSPLLHDQNNSIYNISGQKINNVPQRGIYIINGRKFVVP